MPAGLRMPLGRFIDDELRNPMGMRRPSNGGGLSARGGIPMRAAGGIDTGFRAGYGSPVGRPGYDVATTNWQNQVGKARVGGITGDGRRLDGTGRGMFTKDRVRTQPTRIEREANAQIGIVRAQNEGILGGEAIRAGAERYGTDAGLMTAGMQDQTTRRGQGLEFGLGAKKIAQEGTIAQRADETVRRGQGLEFGARKAETATQRDIAGITDKTTRRGQGLDFKARQEATAVEREKIAAERQGGGLPGVVQQDGIWYSLDQRTGKSTQLPDADQKRLTTVKRLADSFPQSVKREELDAFAQDPTRMVPVYDYQTGRVALKPANTSGITRNWQEDVIGSGKEAQLRYQPLADFEPTAYQAFVEWAQASAGAAR